MKDAAMLIRNARILTEDRIIPNGWLWCDKIIRAFGDGAPPQAADALDARGLMLAPGFIDLHVHGALGAETMDATPQALRTMCGFYARSGVTAYLPTTLTAPHEQVMAALRNVAQCQALAEEEGWGAAIIGAHLEGPYLNAERAGAQFPHYIRRADPQEAYQVLNIGVLRLLAIAPEFEENHWLIEEAVRRGITVSVAHSSATYEQASYGIHLGIRHSTHTYNAMTPLQHRQPGVVGAVLSDSRVICEVICDLHHVHPGAIRTLFAAKGVHGTALITDAMAAAGMPDGEYTLGAHEVVKVGGRVTLKSDKTLAGSAAAYHECVRNFVQAVDRPFEQVWQVTSQTPARAIGEAHLRGSIARGKRADLVLLDDDINVYATIVGGRLAHSAL